MSDLISRQAAIEKRSPQERLIIAKTLIESVLDELPSAQPSSRLLKNITIQYPEVLCVNCKHCEHRNNDEPYCHHHAMVVTPDYFCADGEEGEWMP